MSLFIALKCLHILCAIVAVGFNFSYGFWLTIGRRSPRDLPFILKNVQAMDRSVANPAYMGLGVTGPLMVWLGGYPWSALWIWMSLLLLALAAVLGIAVYSPLLKRQIQALQTKGAGSKQYKELERQSVLLGLGLWALVLVIIFLMVAKVS